MFAHSADRGGQICADAILSLCLTTCRLRVLDWWISVWGPWSGSECRMPLCIHEGFNWWSFTVPSFTLDFRWFVKSLWMLKGTENTATEGKLALRHFYNSMDVFSWLMFKHWFFRVARIFFLAIKHHVACQKYHYFGWILPLVLLLLKGSLNVFLLNDSDTKRAEDYTENESGSQNVTRALFCQNCNWLVNLILEFTSYIKILVSL